MQYERAHFDPDFGNWHDLRNHDKIGGLAVARDGQRFMTHWCHGAAGIGLARTRSLRRLDDADVRREVAGAAAATLATGMGLNHSLCHGDLGNIEFLSEAGRALDVAAWRSAADAYAGGVLDAVLRSEWKCGYPAWLESPSLMMGLAGIGYGLLRLAEPERVPSILLLDAPPLT
jgi:lantibiotic modifying enzyme